ncbi:MAG: glycosyltransferase [Bacteroidales bacterium]
MESTKINGVVCFFNSCKAWGGGEKWHFEMARRLQEQGVKLILCAYPGSPLYKKAIEANLRVFSFKVGNLSFLNLILFQELVEFFKAEEITHLIVNMSSDVKTAARAAKKAGVPNIIYRRGSAIPINNSPSNRYLFRHVVTHIIANSQETMRTILANNQNLFDERKIQVIYNGIDLSDLSFDTKCSKPDHQKEIVLGNAGRLEKQKNQEFLIDLVVRLRQKGYPLILKIAGTGRLEDKLKKAIENRGLNAYVELTGFSENISSFLESVDIFVLSSLWEGFGYVLVEAHACGKPVVAFDVSSNPEIVNNNEDGILVPVNDLEGFADAVEYLIQNPEIRFIMGKNGQNKVLEKFDIEVTTHNLLNYLKSLE